MAAPSRLTQGEFKSLIANEGISLRIGPFNAHIQVPFSELHDTLWQLYADYPLIDPSSVFSFHAKIQMRRNLPHFHRRLVRFSVEGRMPHEDMPAAQALAVLEWGINLVVALRSHCFLMLHSAVLEKNGLALLLPAAPGFGKSTLCAALAHRGWRLLSDEFGLIRPGTAALIPIPRPIALKNQSIGVFKSFASDAWVGPSIAGTRKGTVAHVKPPTSSVLQQSQTVPARWIVFPKWQADAPLELEELSKSQGFMMLAMNAFNYELLGEAGFRTVSGVIGQSDCFRLVYSDLNEVVQRLEQMAGANVGGAQ